MDARESELRGDISRDDPEQIEQAIGCTRARLDGTVTALQDKLTARNLAGSIADALTHGAGVGSRKAVQGIRNNPIPAALVGLGIGWLIVDHYRASRTPAAPAYPRSGSTGWEPATPDYARSESGMRTGARHATEKIGEGAQQTKRWVTERTSHLAHTVGDTVRHGAVAAGEKASHLAQNAREMAGRAGQGLADTFERNPLVMAAGVFALGLIAGMAAPTTKAEDRLMGRASRDLKDRAKTAGKQAVQAGERIASRAAEAAQSAQTQGDTVGGRLSSAARAAADAALDEAEHQATDLGQTLRSQSRKAGDSMT